MSISTFISRSALLAPGLAPRCTYDLYQLSAPGSRRTSGATRPSQSLRRRRRPVVFLEEGKAPAEILLAYPGSVVRRLHLAWERAEQDQRQRSLRVRRGKERRHRTSLGETQQG